MNIGLPRKKRHFDLLTSDSVSGNCFLDGNKLYLSIWDYTNIDEPKCAAKVLDLDNFDGDINNYPSFFLGTNEDFTFIPVEDYVFCSSEWSMILDRKKYQVIFSETEHKIPDDWEEYGGVIKNGFYYRRVSDEKSKRIDILDISNTNIINQIETDIKNIVFVADELIVGTRPNGNFAIFSISKNEYIYELNSEQYFNCTPSRDIKFSYSDNKIALSCNGIVVVVDVQELEVIHHIHCLETETMKNTFEKYRRYDALESNFSIENISFADNRIIVNGNKFFTYVACIDLTLDSENIKWVFKEWDPTYSHYIGGDLVFGIEDSRPVAWDVFSGEMVWQASAGTIANRIQIGDGWVVYSQLSGYIQCFKWRKPYLSPHHV